MRRRNPAFRDERRDLLNPATATADAPSDSAAEENIHNSARAFEDEDRDGDDSDRRADDPFSGRSPSVR